MAKLKICFILSGNLSTTPRAVKQIHSLQDKGFSITVYSVNRSSKWDLIDKQILENLNIDKLHSIDLSHKNSLWLRAKSAFFLSKFFLKLKCTNLSLFVHASNITDYLLLLFLKKDIASYDFIAGFSGAMYPCLLFSKNKKVPFVFDVEDFHPGESTDDKINTIKAKIMISCLSASSFVTYASPLIGEKVKELLGDKMPSSLLINNNFPSIEFITPKYQTGKIRFVWFSQTISFKRGLELVIKALEPFKDKLELTLIGNLDKTFEQEWILPHNDFISIIPTLSQQGLHQLLSTFDIGLALEINSRDLNNRIALSNKIWAYLQSGLYIVVTDTPAQIGFMDQYASHGVLVEQNVDKIKIAIENIVENIPFIRNRAKERYEIAKLSSWDYEQTKWLAVVEQALKK